MISFYLGYFTMRRSHASGLLGRAQGGRSLQLATRIASLIIGLTVTASAQTLDVGNEFVVLHADPTQNCGRIWIQGGHAGPSTDFLFHGGFITSNLVFKITRGGNSTYYCNALPSYSWRPKAPGMAQPIGFRGYDSSYVSSDTIALVYRNLSGYNVVVRYIAERPSTIYDRGSDILMEFSYELLPFSPDGELGIFMMLDCYNSDAQGGGGQGDRSSVMTTEGYFPFDNFGRKFTAPFDTIPQFYHVGNFKYTTPLNVTFPIHRLQGYSHGGAPLTTPEMFAIGGWPALRDIGWDPTSDISAQQIGDVATAIRWSGLAGSGTVRTAFGLNDEAGNNNFICRDDKIFVDIHTVRIVSQAVKNGPYTPAQFDVEAWVSNLSDVTAINPYIRLNTPIRSLPNLSGRLTLDPSTPAIQPLQLGPKATKKLVWRLNVNSASTDTLAQLSFDYRPDGAPAFKTLASGCTPLINVNGVVDNPPPPPQDTVPPVIQFDGPAPSRISAPLWTYTTFDRHPSYDFDSGLDKIMIWSTDGNFTLKTTPSVFRQCDKSVNVGITAQVVDINKPGHLVFAVFDCKGNRTLDSAFYVPVVDPYAPEIAHIDSLNSEGGYDLNGPGCNTRIYDVSVVDSSHKEQFSQDFGFGSIMYDLPPVNFGAIEINPTKPVQTIFPYDKQADFRLRVIDSMQDGSALVKITDYAGNATSMAFVYCTLPDTLPPLSTVTLLTSPPTYAREWTIDATDRRAWDRGLKEVVVISPPDPNFVFNAPTITPGDPETIFNVGLIDDSKDGSITLEVRDLQYATSPARHADTITLKFNRIPDERAPNIIFTPDVAKNGSEANVEVNDIHYDNGNILYKYDLGLQSVNVVSITPNMTVSPIVFSTGASQTTFRVTVIDTLTLNRKDSICIEAVDVAGNRSMNCFYYPIVPDTIAPIFVGELLPDFSAITGIATDSRSYDRGLGSITIENEQNLDPTFSMASLNGAHLTPMQAAVTDPTKPVGGTLVIRDFIGTIDQSPAAQAIHTVRIPFYVPAISAALHLPATTEGNMEFSASIIATDALPTGIAGGIDSISFEGMYNGNVEFRGSADAKAQLRVDASQDPTLHVTAVLDQSRTYQPGDTLGTLRFYAHQANDVTVFNFRMMRATAQVNAGGGRVVSFKVPGDTAISLLKLPSPLFSLGAGDSVTVINGDCGRILTSDRSSSKLAVLAVLPQPANITAGHTVQIDIRNLPASGADGELVSADGQTVARFRLAGSSDPVTRVPLPLPAELNSGVYHLRITGESGTDVVKIVISD